jgi:putative ABC transport system ATP-binding protein
MKMKQEIIIKADKLKRVYDNGTVKTMALQNGTVTIYKGEFVAIMGASGSGKSTLLHQLGLLDVPSSGKLTILGENVLILKDDDASEFRLRNLGYVFQSYNLVPELTAIENVYISLLMGGIDKETAKKKAAKVLVRVGLGDRLNYYPSELSGGQQQRVSIARALVNNPKIIFADEPTANLDSASTNNVLDLFKELNKKYNQTIVMVTHEPGDEKIVDRVIWLADGVVEDCDKK